MSSPPAVLITGGNGFVGYAVLAGTLKAGVRVSLSLQDILVPVHIFARLWDSDLLIY